MGVDPRVVLNDTGTGAVDGVDGTGTGISIGMRMGTGIGTGIVRSAEASSEVE